MEFSLLHAGPIMVSLFLAWPNDRPLTLLAMPVVGRIALYWAFKNQCFVVTALRFPWTTGSPMVLSFLLLLASPHDRPFPCHGIFQAVLRRYCLAFSMKYRIENFVVCPLSSLAKWTTIAITSYIICYFHFPELIFSNDRTSHGFYLSPLGGLSKCPTPGLGILTKCLVLTIFCLFQLLVAFKCTGLCQIGVASLLPGVWHERPDDPWFYLFSFC